MSDCEGRVLLPSWVLVSFFENLPSLAVVCVGVAVAEDGGAFGGLPRFAVALRTRGGGFGDDVSDSGGWAEDLTSASQ